MPQGRQLRPVSYLNYANDLNNIITKVDTYADDGVLVLNGENLDEIVNIMNETLKKVSMWCI